MLGPCGPFAVDAEGGNASAEGGNASAGGGNAGAEGGWRAQRAVGGARQPIFGVLSLLSTGNLYLCV